MLGYLTLAAWTVTIGIGLTAHGIKRLPVGIVLPHAALALTGYVVWIFYLANDRPTTFGWFAVAWVIVVNGLGDLSVIRRRKSKAQGGSGIFATYVKRLRSRPILFVHAVSAGVTTVLAVLTVLGY